MAEKFDVAPAIRFISKVVAWITSFVAPIKVVYDYVHSGKLAAEGITTQLSLGQVIWNLFINSGYFMLCFFVFLFINMWIIGFPIALIMAFTSPERLKQDSPFSNLISIGVAVLTLIATFPLMLGIVGLSLGAQKHNLLDDCFGVVGGIYLSSIYIYVYLAATGNLPEERPA